MLETGLLLLAGVGKAALLDAAKQRLKEWLADTLRVERAIQKTASAFSTKLPSAQEALETWVKTEAFRAAMDNLLDGGLLPEQIANPDEFLASTGMGFGASSLDTVRSLLGAFFKNIREDLLGSQQGLVLIDNRMAELQRQFEELRTDLAAQTLPDLSQVNTQLTSAGFLSQIAQTQGWGAGLGYGAEIHVNLELPPAVQNLATRRAAVQTAHDIFANTAWYAMHGGSGTGKTQLAILIARTFSGFKVWIRLGGQLSAAGLILESAIARLAQRLPGQSTEHRCEAACARLGPDSLIVIDDLPFTPADAALSEHLAALCTACVHRGVRLLTTSARPLVPSARTAAEGHVHEDAVPDFAEDDTRDLFRAYGASESFLTSPWLRLAHHTARGHPLLLVEAARYLQTRGWAADDRSFDDLIGGNFASALDLPTVERIRQTVPEPVTREFLYRLKLIGWPFGIEEVQRISAVPPSVPLAVEHLASLVGLWVQQDSDREYVVSPLVARLSDDNLPRELQRAIHVELANGILEKRILGPSQASQAVTHFMAAGDANSAANVVLVAWHGMLRMPKLQDAFGLTSIWAEMPLPEAIKLEKRIYLRTFQVILRRRLGRDEQYERTDLERLMIEGESDDNCQLIIAGSGAMLATYLGDSDPALAIRSVTNSIKATRRVPPEIARDPDLALHTGLLMMLWGVAAWIKSDDQYQEWFAAVRGLTPDETRQWLNIRLADQASQTVCDGMWMRTADLPESERNWVRVREHLEQLLEWARSAGITQLAASALRSQIIVLAEYERALPDAEALARAGMAEFRESPHFCFLIADTMARQHYYFGAAADAIRWFDLAFADLDTAAPNARVGSLTLAGVSARRVNNVNLARSYFERGVVAARAVRVVALSRVTIEGEFGILLWNDGQLREAYTHLSAAAHELLEARRDTRAWKTLFRLFGNCTGYFLSELRGVAELDAEVTVPFSGILLREVKDIDQLHDPQRDWMLPVQMMLLAESLGLYDEAIRWAQETAIGEGAIGAGAQGLLAPALTAGNLAVGRWAEILSSVDLGDLDEATGDVEFARLDDESRAQRFGRFTARLTLVALAIHIARVGLQDHASAQTIAHSAAEFSRDCSARCGGSRFWYETAGIFEALENRGSSWRELWDKAAAARAQGNSSLQVMYGVAATVVAGPQEAVQIQIQIVPWLERLFSPTLYHVTVAGFVREYWRWAFDQFPMSFGLLDRTRKALAEAQGLEDNPAVHAVLRAIAFSLAIKMPDDIRRWLDGDSA